jgi:hypothetical protein
MRSVVSFGMATFILFFRASLSVSLEPETPATIQTRETVQRLYGGPVSEVYRTPQKLRITASFAPNGNLCQAHIGSDAGLGITDAQLNPVLDELAPKDVRGEYKMGTFLNITCLKEDAPPNSSGKIVIDPCIDCSGVSEDYERVKITKYGNTNQYSSVHVIVKRRECKDLDKVR